MNEVLETGGYGVALGYYPALPDPSDITTLLSFFSSSNGADVEAQTKLADEALVELDTNKRAQVYGELQDLIAEEENMVVLDYQPLVYPTQDSVVGVDSTRSGTFCCATPASPDRPEPTPPDR